MRFNAEFYVIDKLTQDIILGVELTERTGALLDYMYNGTIDDPARVVYAAKNIRIPTRHETIIPVKVPKLSEIAVGITETVPRTSAKGLSYATTEWRIKNVEQDPK